MSDINDIYRISVKCARDDANKKVICTQKAYDTLKDKNSDYAIVVRAVLDLYIKSAEVYNSAPSEINLNKGE